MRNTLLYEISDAHHCEASRGAHLCAVGFGLIKQFFLFLWRENSDFSVMGPAEIWSATTIFDASSNFQTLGEHFIFVLRHLKRLGIGFPVYFLATV